MLLNPVADCPKEFATVSDAGAIQVQTLFNPASSNPEAALNSVADQSDQHEFLYEPNDTHLVCRDCNGTEIVPTERAVRILCRLGKCGNERKVEEDMIQCAITEKDMRFKKCKCKCFPKWSWWWRSAYTHKRKHFSPFQTESYVRNEIHKRLRIWGYKVAR